MINAFYAKLIEDLRKRMSPDFIDKTDKEKLIETQSETTVQDKIGEYEKINFISFNLENTIFTTLIFVGFCMLELSDFVLCLW